jgi:hypothetical protein
MQNLSALEKQVLTAMARADRERGVMEQQIEAARVTAREYTSVGFFTDVSTPEHIATTKVRGQRTQRGSTWPSNESLERRRGVQGQPLGRAPLT